MNIDEFNVELLSFLSNSTSPFHATAEMIAKLNHNGFEELKEAEDWKLQPNGKYWVTKNDSSLIAFVLGEDFFESIGAINWKIVGAHTDSPCLKVKPNPVVENNSGNKLTVETYGGVLLSTWFDRDLSLSGRVTVRTAEDRLRSVLIDFKRPIAVIPNLAIHLNRSANEQRTINKQTEMNLVLGINSESDFELLVREQALQQYPEIQGSEIYSHELVSYDTQAPALAGIDNEFILSGRLDNLLSCFIGLKSLTDTAKAGFRMLVCNDHEEVGSQSASGAQGPFLKSVLERIICAQTSQVESSYRLSQSMSGSMLVSADNAHGLHPNYLSVHDEQHGPIINAGPVIKVNANQRYASNSETVAVFKRFCEEVGVMPQTFVTRSDMACGSTIGPITSAELGIPAIDVGCSQWAMHSARETAGAKDAHSLYRVLKAFYQHPGKLI